MKACPSIWLHVFERGSEWQTISICIAPGVNDCFLIVWPVTVEGRVPNTNYKS